MGIAKLNPASSRATSWHLTGQAIHGTRGCPEQNFVLALDAGQFTPWQELACDGSGGDPVIFFSDSSGQQGELFFLRSLTSGANITEKQRPDGLPDILEEIRTTFGLSQSELAEALGLTRKALYDWQKGATPRRKSAERLRQLHRAAMDWKRSGFPVPGRHQLHMTVVRDSSLLGLLRDEPLDLEAIHFAGARMAMRGNFEQESSLADPFA